jgi:hypothetical protein
MCSVFDEIQFFLLPALEIFKSNDFKCIFYRFVAAFEFAAPVAPKHTMPLWLRPARGDRRGCPTNSERKVGGRRPNVRNWAGSCRNLLLQVPEIGKSTAPDRLQPAGDRPVETCRVQILQNWSIPAEIDRQDGPNTEAFSPTECEKLPLNRLFTLTFRIEKEPVQASL